MEIPTLKFIDRSRNWITFEMERYVPIDEGMRYDNGQIQFPVDTFKTLNDCEQWYSKKTEDLEQVNRGTFDYSVKSLDITNDEWDKIKKFMINPGVYKAKDFRVYEDQFANNFKDRDDQRFPIDFLRAIVKTIIGRPRMFVNPHMWNMPGQGKYFEAWVEEISKEEVLKQVSNITEHFRKVLNYAIERDGALYVAKGKFYIRIQDHEPIIRSIDDGTAKDSSVGVISNRPRRITDDGGEFLVEEFYIGPKGVEAVEVSNPGVPAQHLTTITKSLIKDSDHIDKSQVQLVSKKEFGCIVKDVSGYEEFARINKEMQVDNKPIDVIYGINKDSTDILGYRLNKEIWTAKDAEEFAKTKSATFEDSEPASTKTKNDGGKTIMKFELPNGFTKELTPDEASVKTLNTEVSEEFEKQADEFEITKKNLETTEASLKEKETELTSANEKVTKFRDYLIEEVVRFGNLAGIVKAENSDAKKTSLEGFTFEQLVETHKEYKAVVNAKNLDQSQFNGLGHSNNGDANAKKDVDLKRKDDFVLA